jgi:DNA invertase Pin-like site-specific DNA recombinase
VTGGVSRLARSTLQVLEIGQECIERDFISSRKKEALAKRKAEGMKLGRPVGSAKNHKLDKHADKIDGYLAKGINKVAIAKLLDVSPNMLYEWLKVRRPGSTPPRDSVG